MKAIYTLVIFLIPFISFSQISATTEKGEKVVLKEDGTWQYIDEIKTDVSGSGIWEIKYFVDDFGDPTNKGYIASDILSGTFSNSATSNSDLLAYFIISDSSSVAIKLFEYGSNAVKAYSTDYYVIKVKNSFGTTYNMNGVIYKGGDRLHIDDSYKKNHTSDMHKILINGGQITMVIKEKEYSLTSYKLSFNADGYKNVFKTLFK